MSPAHLTLGQRYAVVGLPAIGAQDALQFRPHEHDDHRAALQAPDRSGTSRRWWSPPPAARFAAGLVPASFVQMFDFGQAHHLGSLLIRWRRRRARIAGSRASRRLVAATTATRPRASRPSSSTNNWAMSCTLYCWLIPSRRGARQSISSIKSTLGAHCRQRAKICRRWASLSPTHLDRISGPLMISRWAWLSVATALASSVLPLPGGPYKRTHSTSMSRASGKALRSSRCHIPLTYHIPVLWTVIWKKRPVTGN